MKYILGVGCGKRESGVSSQGSVVRSQRGEGRSLAGKAMAPRNRTECDREIVTLPAEGHTHKRVAGHRGLKHRTITPALEEMRHCYTTPPNQALMALEPASIGSISPSIAPTLRTRRPTWGFG